MCFRTTIIIGHGLLAVSGRYRYYLLIHLSNVRHTHLQYVSINSSIHYNYYHLSLFVVTLSDKWHTLLFDPFIMRYFSLRYCSGLFNQSIYQWTCDIIRTLSTFPILSLSVLVINCINCTCHYIRHVNNNTCSI